MRHQKGKQVYVRGVLTIMCLLMETGIYQLSAIKQNYSKEQKIHQELLVYKPE